MEAIQRYMEKHGFEQFEPKAVLFDMDGVIYDSMPNHAVTWREAMADYGLQMPPDGAYRYEGMRGVETIRLLACEQWGREITDDEAQRMYSHKSKLFAERTRLHPAPLMTGIRQLMEQLKADGMTLCVVTGSGQHSLLDRLVADLDGLIDRERIVTAFDVKHGKPHPEPYLRGMQKCGVEPWQSMVVENAPLGVQAAVAARCLTAAVNTGPLPDKVLQDAGADLVLPDMDSLRSVWVQQLASCRR